MGFDKDAFYRWFRKEAFLAGVPSVSLKFFNSSQKKLEKGRFDPSTKTIYINEDLDELSAMQTALHELAHAIVFKRYSQYFKPQENALYYDPNNNLANLALMKMKLTGGHDYEWRRVASSLGVDVSKYIKEKPNKTPKEILREALFGKRD